MIGTRGRWTRASVFPISAVHIATGKERDVARRLRAHYNPGGGYLYTAASRSVQSCAGKQNKRRGLPVNNAGQNNDHDGERCRCGFINLVRCRTLRYWSSPGSMQREGFGRGGAGAGTHSPSTQNTTYRRLARQQLRRCWCLNKNGMPRCRSGTIFRALL